MGSIGSLDAIKISIAPKAYTLSTDGTAVDTLSVNDIMAFMLIGNWTDGTHTPVVEESDDGSTNWTAATVSNALEVISAAGDENKVAVNYVTPAKRYLRIKVTAAGTTVGAEYAGGFLFGRSQQRTAFASLA